MPPHIISPRYCRTFEQRVAALAYPLSQDLMEKMRFFRPYTSRPELRIAWGSRDMDHAPKARAVYGTTQCALDMVQAARVITVMRAELARLGA